MDTSLRRRRSERQDPDFQDVDQAQALEAETEDPASSEGPAEAHLFWSERAKAEVELQRARPQSLREARKLPEVKVDEVVLEPDYDLGPGGKGRGASPVLESEVVRAASGRADGHSRNKVDGVQRGQELFLEQAQHSRGFKDSLAQGPKQATKQTEPVDLLSMSPMKMTSEGINNPRLQPPTIPEMEGPFSLPERENQSPKPSAILDVETAGHVPMLQHGATERRQSGVQDLSNSGVPASEVGEFSRIGGPRMMLGNSAGSTLQEFSSTTGVGASEGKVLNRSHLELDSGTARVGNERAESVSEGTARRSIPLSPEAQKPQKSSAYEIPDPSEQHFEIVRLQSLVEHLHDRLEKAEAERSTRGSRSFGSASSGRRVEELELKGQRVNFQSEEGYPLPPEPPRQSSLDMDFGTSVHSPMVFPGDMVPSMDFGLHSFTGFLRWTLDFILLRVLDLSTSLCLPVVNGSLVLEPVDFVPPPPPQWTSPLVAAPPIPGAYNPNNPTALGDWIAVVQPMISSLSDTGSVWWGYTYQAANQAYVRWLSTSPLERLSIQKEFDQVNLVQPQHTLLEQRCVTLILQAIPDAVRVDVAASTLSEAAKLLRQWTQWRMRLKQLHAAEPDTTLLVKGLDDLTGRVLQKHSASLFRLATFRERLGVDYQPTSDAVSELCRMMQAEVEHLMHSTDDNPVKDEVPGRGDDAKKQRLQRLQTSPSTPKAKTSPAGPKTPGAGMKPCRSWLTAGGCAYGSSCQFFHDQDEEKMRGRCFSCSAEDHWADSCPVKARLKAEAKAANEDTGDGNAAINAEILSVLRSIKTKALRLSAVSNPTGYGLLDSGASASLRQASPQEIQESRPVSVSLAVGEAVMHVNSAGTLLVRESVHPILPMHALPLLGCEINWTDRGIHVRHPGLGILPVRLKDGTPELPEFLVLRLIGEYERFLLRRETSRAVSQQLWQRSVGQEEVGLSSLREWVAAHVEADSLRLVSPTFDPSCVPFNRRTRRQLFDPQVPTLVHLFAGKQRWRHSVGQVLEVDISRGSDLLSDDVFGMLLRAATLGVIDGVVCGPPSRTFNPEALASSSNGLKFRGEEGDARFGFSDLSPADRALVDRDTLLFLRSLLLTLVASCAKEKFFNCLEMPESSTAWEWPEYENVSVCLGGWTASFDQGTLGHPCSKATAVYTSSFQLYESLHELKLPPEVIEAPAPNFYGKEWAPGLVSRVLRAWDDYCCVSFERLQAHTREREGLLLNLCQEATVAKMSPEVWERHCQADHLPYRDDCPICIQGASRDRSHFTKHPHLFELSSDVAGAYHKGRDFGGACRYFVIFTIRAPVKSDKKEWRDKSSEIAFQEKVDEAKAQDKEDPHASLIYQPVHVTGEPLKGDAEQPSRVKNRRDRSPRRDPDAGPAFRVARLFSNSGGSPSATEAFSPCDTFCKQVILEGNSVSTGQLANAIRLYVQDKKAINRIAKRPLAGNQKDESSGATLPPWFWSSGAWVFSAKVGITNTVHECPWLTRLLAVSLFHRTGQKFASVGFVINIESEVHRDSHNSLESMNVVWNVGQGSGSLEICGHEMPLPPNAWLSFPPRDLHKSGSWEGDKILVLGYTPRSLERLTSSDLLSLRWVNMPIQDIEPLQAPPASGEFSPGDGLSKLLPAECDSGDEEVDLPTEESWSQVAQGYELMHQAVTHFLKSLQRSVVGASSEGPVDPITLQAMREASSLRNELGWHLELARLYGCDKPVSSSSWRVCAAAPAVEHLESQPLLHTRIVSNEEVREKLHEWRDAMKAECDSLISKGAVELVADSQVEKWILDGEDVEILPGRGVATEKPPVTPGSTKRNKYRAVICGNFQKWSEERAAESFYAGGADSLSIRTALRWAGMRKHGGSGTDVKTAFLNAPLDEQEAEYLICNPPKVLYAAGVIPRGYKWRVHGALYGLQTSPRAWSRLRDKTCRVLTWTVDGENRHLQQCVADPNIWLVKSPCGETVALMCWYVDDLLVLGPWSERSALLEKIKATWECSAFTHTEDGPVEYCGLEISESADGLLIGQTKYIKELLKRHNVQGSAKSPCAAWSANFDDGESRDDPVDPVAVKAAQSITGELLWLSVRARPELSFPVSRMAQLTTKRPNDAISIGQGVLRFLNSSPSQCIVYGPPPGDCGTSQQYPRPVVETTLHAFADASFGPSSGRSHQGLLVCWAGAPLHWESGRQTLTALSTAESELISYVCVVQAAEDAEAVEALIGEIFPEPLTRSLFGDNSSAISIVSGPPTSWRSRHLRLRSHALPERIENGVWTVYHLSGLLMPADILTKAMTASKFGDMLPFLGVKNPSEDYRLQLAAVLACCALLLKGQGSPEPEGWGWVIMYLVVVILAYEGFRSFLRRFLGLVAYVFPGLGARFPGVLDVHSSPVQGTTQPPAASAPPSSSTQLPAPGARLPRDPSSSIGARLPGGAASPARSTPNLRSIGVNTNPEDYAPLPPVLPAAPAAAYRHPIDLDILCFQSESGYLRLQRRGGDLQGKRGGSRTLFSVSRGSAFEDQELVLFGQAVGMFLTIEADGSIGASVSRRSLLCEWLTSGSEEQRSEALEAPEAEAATEGLRNRLPKSEAAEAEPESAKPEEKAPVPGEPTVFEDAGGLNESLEPEAFWAKELQNAPIFELNFPPLHPLDAYLTREVGRAHRVLSGQFVPEVVLAAWVLLLCRYSRAEEVLLLVSQGSPVALRLASLEQLSLQQAADAYRNRLADARSCWADVPSDILKCRVGFLFGPAATDLDWTAPCGQGRLMLQLQCELQAEGLTCTLVFEQGLLSTASATRALEHLEALLSAELSLPAGSLEVCNETEQWMLLDWSDQRSERYLDSGKCIHHFFQEQASTAPSRTAIIEDSESLTYAQLAAEAGQVASELLSADVTTDSLVPLMSHRCTEMVIAIFGILFAGGGYVPLDTKWPDDRVMEVISQCAPRAVCAGPGFAVRLQSLVKELSTCSILDIKRRQSKSLSVSVPMRVGSEPNSTNAVYCFFTSGSSGKPKGVVVEHRGLVHRILWFQDRWQMQPGECGILKHSYTFGLSEWEIFWPLSVGGTLVLCRPDGEKDMEYLWQLSEQYRVRTQVFVPSVLRALLEYAELEFEDQQVKLWPDLKAAITCGEALPPSLAQQFFDFLPHATLDNLYGPTEGEMTVWRLPMGRILQSMPIGEPMEGSRILICSSGGLAGVGEPGEIYFGGDFIARGYLGMPELTEEKFVLDRFLGAEGTKLYASGDLARWRESGILDFLGRADFQVKLRGFRIELGEIEEALRAAGAKNSVCIVVGQGTQQRLVAYVIMPGGDQATLRAACTSRLPAYMVPAQVVFLEAMPRTASGKIDRKALPAPPEPQGESEEAVLVVEPRDSLEERIREIWAKVLDRAPESLSVEADWPLVGGNSLLAGKATSLLRKELGVQLPGTAMYTNSTIAKLALLASKLGATVSGDEPKPVETNQEAVPGKQRYQAQSARSPSALCAQFLVAVAGNLLGDNFAWMIRWLLAWVVYQAYGRSCLILCLPGLLAALLVLEAAVCIALKQLIVGRLEPGRYPLFGKTYFLWLFQRHLVEKCRDRISEFISGTCLLVHFYRALGADIGERVDLNDPELEEPDLVSIGSDVSVNHARICAAGLMDGELILGAVKVQSRSCVMPRAMLVMGTDVPSGSEVSPLASTSGWMGAVGAVCPLQSSKIERVTTQDYLRLAVGLPWLLFLHSAAIIPTIYALEMLWAVTGGNWIFWLLSPLVYRHGFALTFFLLTVLQKRALVGRLLPGPTPEEGSWAWHKEAFRTWLHEQAVCARSFDDAMDPFVGTEVLSIMYRMLGSKIGRRVQMDTVYVAEHDCFTVEDDVVFGSVVSAHCAGAAGRQEVKLLRGANVLDHGVLMPGTFVGERAVLGSASLAPADSYFPPDSINTGQVGGKPVRLRFQTSTEEQVVTEWEAMRRLNSDEFFWGFNFGVIAAAIVCSPVPIYQCLLTCLLGWKTWASYGPFLAFLSFPFAYAFISLVVLSINYILKWRIIGKYEEGDYTFFSNYHLSWTVMMILSGVMEDAVDALQGTEFLVWYYRLMGAKVGQNCCLFGLALEYDLLTMGDGCCVGWECDTTCHTVENMVIKLAPTVLESYTSMLPHSMVSPGAVLHEGAVVLENSQVLKGEQVPADECWAGLPASSCGPVGALPIETVQEDEKADEIQQEAQGEAPAEVQSLPEGLEALSDGAVVALAGQTFLVEKLKTGDILLFVFEEDGKSLSGHLRVRATGRADFAGRRGPAARFFASKGSSAATVCLQTVGTGMCLHFDEASQLFFGDTNPGDLVVKQISQASTIKLSQEVLQQRRRQEANLLVQERRRKAAYALQSSTARETFSHGRAQRGRRGSWPLDFEGRSCDVVGREVLARPAALKMVLERAEAMQMDGESWMLPVGCEVEVKWHRQVRMLRPPSCPPGVWRGRQVAGFWHPRAKAQPRRSSI
ncbi:mycC [Symbiodinium sp. CCMP2592]|nr:mycC [Symbiodinium sp. CCMP2592]